ncbi:MAG: tRNA (adenosine(37)-N6)-dimethylallyltransferase MiaA [Candidatus Hydrogenedentes bacterium CG1_02_42_14]|nr:MAG: tRNA (adenosine(37)-N6)-dimethylallyltransferase MiaA [Candidatus Hydrogenedentes bacterium CG1_02_42_14]
MNISDIFVKLFSAPNVVPVLVGPTASGKTELIFELAQISKGNASFEVISADAFQVYRGMDIGTAKPSIDILKAVKHYLVDILEPNETFSAGEFIRIAEKKMEEILSRDKRPIVCGGSGLYITSLISGMHELPSADPELRRKKLGREELLSQLRLIDSESAEQLRSESDSRIIRRLEICSGMGLPMSEILKLEKLKSKFSFKVFRIEVVRKKLYERINKRVEEMFEKGFIEEVKRLIKDGINSDMPSQRAIGYREVHEYLEGKMSEEELKVLVAANSRHYAKRQETWFRHKIGNYESIRI